MKRNETEVSKKKNLKLQVPNMSLTLKFINDGLMYKFALCGIKNNSDVLVLGENDNLLIVVNFRLQLNKICLVATLGSIKMWLPTKGGRQPPFPFFFFFSFKKNYFF
jgi:hypothetical protein